MRMLLAMLAVGLIYVSGTLAGFTLPLEVFQYATVHYTLNVICGVVFAILGGGVIGYLVMGKANDF